MRHLLDRGTLDTDGLRHTAKVAWRALALLQRELDAEADRLSPLRAAVADAFGKSTDIPLTAPAVTYNGYDLSGEDYTVDGFTVNDIPLVTYDSRGVWPGDTRVNGLLTCCGQSEHPLDCYQYRA
jgi:hypothetical protein